MKHDTTFEAVGSFRYIQVPSGKRLHSELENHHFYIMGKLTISTGPFSMAMLNYQRVIVIGYEWSMNVG